MSKTVVELGEFAAGWFLGAEADLVAHDLEVLKDVAGVALQLAVVQPKVVLRSHLQTDLQLAVLGPQPIAFAVQGHLHAQLHAVDGAGAAEEGLGVGGGWWVWLAGLDAGEVLELFVDGVGGVGGGVEVVLVPGLALAPLVPALDAVLEGLEVPHDLLVEEAVVTLDLGVALLLQHVLLLRGAGRTFLLSRRRLSEVLMLLMLLRESLRLPSERVCCFETASKLLSSLQRRRCSTELILLYAHQQNQPPPSLLGNDGNECWVGLAGAGYLNLIIMRILLLVAGLLWLCCAGSFQKRELRKWTMKVTEGPPPAATVLNKEYPVSVPSTVHLNLEQHGAIPDPFYSDYIRNIEWVSSCQVSFTTTVPLSQQDLAYSKLKLIFQGIDTYADVYFNEKLLGSTKNAFLKYEFSVEGHAKVGDNTLRVLINSSKPADEEGQKKERMPFDYAYTRKACYQYSWDWAPYMNTMGIWLPVHLHLYDTLKIDYVWIRNKQITKPNALLDIVLALDRSGDDWSLTDQIEVKIKQGIVEKTYNVTSKYSRSAWTIESPKLWWPNGIGQPHVYEFAFQLFRNGNKVDEKKVIHGIRTIELDDKGANFQIIVNGHPIYCKGANYVPPDMMYPRLINPDFKPKNTFQQLLNDAVDSNFNMLRVWGGGQYEVNDFYEMASRKGIMIFQDFMFSDSIYPANDAFIENVQQEIVYQVRRLRNYPCVVLWSGNNQILQGIQSWGWGQANYVSNYEKVFKKLIPNIINVEGDSLPYIQSSPSRGVGNAGFGRGGDVHYWGVWAAGSPFENYETAVGGFNSEFGTQALPAWKSILQFTTDLERSYEGRGFASHERHNSQFRTLKNYQSMYAHPSVNFEMEAYASGLVQAYGIEIAIRAQRTSKPKSFGTLYWQFNDAWPSISWSSIDYYGRWKPLQYKAKQLFKDVIIFYNPKSKKFTAVNDQLYNVNTTYLIQALTFDGKVLFKEEGKINLAPNEVKQIRSLPASGINGYESKGFVYTEIRYGGGEDDKTVVTTFHEPFKNLKLQDAVLSVVFRHSHIEFSSQYLIKSVFIDCEVKVKLSDNYFDVVPGRTTKIYVESELPGINTFKDKFSFKSYRQVYDPSGLRLIVS